MASVPSLLLLSGSADVVLRQARVPAWLAWVLVGFISLVLSARLYLFAVLPTSEREITVSGAQPHKPETP